MKTSSLKYIYICLLIFFLSFLSCNVGNYSKDVSALIPNDGEIVFRQQFVIEDHQKYDSSYNMFKENLKTHLFQSIKEERSDVEAPMNRQMFDAAMNNIQPPAFQNNIDSAFHKHIYQDSLIISFKYLKDSVKPIEDYLILSTQSDTFQYLSKNDSSTFYDKKKLRRQLNDSVRVEEFRNDQIEISGYKCFKVILYKIVTLDGFRGRVKQEMYVTEQIRSPYHPIIWSEKILRNYYPLKIKEYNVDIRGAHLEYNIIKNTLSNSSP